MRGLRRTASGVALALALALGLVACGEPPIDVAIPPRDGHVSDLAGILDIDQLDAQLTAIAEQGLDVVALTYTTPRANCGEAFRAGRDFAVAWEADIALVAVARPGDFTSTDEARVRCLGLRPVDEFAVPRGLREEIAEELVPPIAADNDWDGAFRIAAQRLGEELTAR
ncbi:hypothetical protein BH23ACT9_BH23ACT9_06050 [soil metagenome]